MTAETLTCHEMIIAKIRQLRSKASASRQKGAAGLPLDTLARAIQKSGYDVNTYRDTMMEMIEDGTLVITAFRRRYGERDPRDIGTRTVILTAETIPENFDFKSVSFATDFDGNQIEVGLDDKFTTNHYAYSKTKVYVAEDGLPEVVTSLMK